MKTITLLLIAMSLAFISYGKHEHNESKNLTTKLFDNTTTGRVKLWHHYAKMSVSDMVEVFNNKGPDEFLELIKVSPYPVMEENVMHIVVYKECKLIYHSKSPNLAGINICDKQQLRELVPKLKKVKKEIITFGYTFYNVNDILFVLTIAKKTNTNYIITMEILLAGHRLKEGLKYKDWKQAPRKNLAYRFNDNTKRIKMEKFHFIRKQVYKI